MALTVGIDIRDQSLPFMIEIMDTATGLPDQQYLLPINPESYRKSNPTRATITQTMGGAFQDNKGNGISKISLQGTFGYLGTLPGGPGSSINSDEKDGWGLAMELEATFLDFYDRFGTYNSWGSPVKAPVDPNNLPELRFYNYTDLDFFVVQVDRFDLARTTSRRLLYQYDLQMSVIRRIKQPSITADEMAELLKVITEPKPLTFWENALEWYQAVNGAMSDVQNDLAQLNQDISRVGGAVNGFMQNFSDMINAPFGLLNTITETTDGILNKISNMVNIPHEFVNDLRETKRAMLQLGLRPDLFGDSSTVTITPNSADTSSTEIMTAPIPASTGMESLGVVVMNNPETTLFDPSLEIPKEIAASVAQVTRDDTLETIARKTLGDANGWKRIALLNGLEYPFIVIHLADSLTPAIEWGSLAADAGVGANIIHVTDLTPQAGELLLLDDGTNQEIATVESTDHSIITLEAPLENAYVKGTAVTRHERMLSVMKPGDELQIPGGASSGAAITGDQQEDFYTRIYGTDEYLDDNGEQSADPLGDVRTVSGIDNLAQALQHRLRTTRGELASLGHPTYGSYLPMIIGKIGISLWYQRALLEAEVTMLEDPRVKRINSVKFTIDGTAVYLDADVLPINRTASTKMSIIVN